MVGVLPVVACNNAWRTLAFHGITPDYIVVSDPREENAEWFEGNPPECIYLLALRVHPHVFDKLCDCRVFVWNVADDLEINEGYRDLIGGGTTIVSEGHEPVCGHRLRSL